MATTSTFTLTTTDNLSEIKADSKDPQGSAISLAAYLHKLAAGCGHATMAVSLANTGGVAASGTVTFSSFVATDTITVGGVVFTGSATPSGNAQFLIGADDTATAAAAAVKVAAHPTLAALLGATSSLGVMTVTADNVGIAGNQITLAISAHGSVSGARCASGVDATFTTLSLGL